MLLFKFPTPLNITFSGQTETGWDLGPGTLCCSACTWTNRSFSNKIQRNYKGLKRTARMSSWGKLWTKRYKKTKNPTATSEGPGAKTGCWEKNKGTVHAPCTQHHQSGGADHLSQASAPTPGPTPTLTPDKEPARPTSRSEQGKLSFVLAPHCCSRGPNKAFPVSLINFYSFRKAKRPSW